MVITPDNRLIAGERRLRAAQLLGWTTIPVIIVSLDDIVRGEFAENTQRKDFTWTEAVAIGREVKLLEKAAAKQRQRAGGRAGGQASGKLPQASKGSTGDKVAKAVGKKRRTLEKAEATSRPLRLSRSATRIWWSASKRTAPASTSFIAS